MGLLDGQRDSKNADVYKRIAASMNGTTTAGKALGKEYLNLTASGQEFAQELVNSNKPIEETKKAFLDASTNANKMSLSSKAAAVGMQALNVAMNVGIMLAVSAAISGIIAGIDYLINYQEKLVESANKLSEEYKQLQSDVSSLQEQLKANQAKIDEINKNPLDIIGKETLKTLQLENEKLDRQLQLAIKLSEEKKKEAGEVAYKALSSKDTGYGEVSRSELFGSSRKQGTYGEAAQYNIEKIKELNSEIASLDTTSKTYEKSKADLERQIGYENDELIKNVENIGNLKTQLDLTNPSQKEMYNNLTEIQDAYISLQTLSTDLNTFEEIYDVKATEEQKNKLFELAQQGELTAESFEENYGILAVLFKSIGLSIDDVVAKIIGLSQESSNQTSNLAHTSDSLAQSIQAERDATNELLSSMNMLSSAFAEQNADGSLSIDTMFQVVDAGYAAALSFDAQTGACTLNREALLGLIQVKIQNQIKDLEIIRTNLGQKLIADGIAAAQSSTGFLTLANAKAAANNSDFKSYQEATAQIKALEGALKKSGDVAAGNFSTGMKSAGSAAKSAGNDISQAMSKAKSAIQSLLTMTMSMIKQQLNDQKKAIQNQLDALSNRYNEEKKHLDSLSKQKKKQYDADKKAVQDELEGYKKKIEIQLELLRAKEEERDYQKELSEKTKEVADLETDLAVKGLDTSDEGVRKRLELENELAKKKQELDEFQHDKSIERTEDILNKEIEDFEEKTNKKIDILDKENEVYEEMHQARMDAIEAEYEHRRETLDAQQKDIEEKVSNEAAIRAEAIRMIEDKNSGLYQKLIDWNDRYGTGIREEVDVAWQNAYASLEKFGGSQFSVLGVLGQLTSGMNDFDLSTKNSSGSMSGLQGATDGVNSALREAISNADKLALGLGPISDDYYKKITAKPTWDVYSNNNSLKQQSLLPKRHGGAAQGTVSTTELSPKAKSDFESTFGKLQSNEVPTILKQGELVLTPEQQSLRTRRAMADYINGVSSIGSFGISANMDTPALNAVTAAIGTSSLSQYERIDNSPIDINVENKFDVRGNIDKNALPHLEKILEMAVDKTRNEIMKQASKAGRTRNVKHFSL